MTEGFNGYSPADMAAVFNGGGCNGNNQWNNPMWLIWAILFGNGAFGFGGNRQGVSDAEVQGKLNALSQQIQDNQNTNMLAGSINSNHDFLHSFQNAVNLGFANTASAISNASMTNLLGQKDMQAQMAQCCCDIKSNILNQTNQLQAQLASVANNITQGFTQVGFLTQQQTNELNNNNNANTQRMLDAMCQMNTQNLRDKLDDARQSAQTANIINALKTTTAPAAQA